MEEKLIKFDLHCGFNCVPELTAEKYPGEVYDGDRILQDPRAMEPLELTSSNSARINEIWMTFKDGTMSWHVYSVVRDGEGEDFLSKHIERMHEALVKIIDFNARSLMASVSQFKIPDEARCLEMYKSAMGELVIGGGMSVPEDDLFVEILEGTKEFVESQVQKNEMLDDPEFREFCKTALTGETVRLMMKGIVIAKKINGNYVFKMREQYENILKMVPMKLGGDIIGRFLENLQGQDGEKKDGDESNPR